IARTTAVRDSDIRVILRRSGKKALRRVLRQVGVDGERGAKPHVPLGVERAILIALGSFMTRGLYFAEAFRKLGELGLFACRYYFAPVFGRIVHDASVRSRLYPTGTGGFATAAFWPMVGASAFFFASAKMTSLAF